MPSLLAGAFVAGPVAIDASIIAVVGAWLPAKDVLDSVHRNKLITRAAHQLITLGLSCRWVSSLIGGEMCHVTKMSLLPAVNCYFFQRWQNLTNSKETTTTQYWFRVCPRAVQQRETKRISHHTSYTEIIVKRTMTKKLRNALITIFGRPCCASYRRILSIHFRKWQFKCFYFYTKERYCDANPSAWRTFFCIPPRQLNVLIFTYCTI